MFHAREEIPARAIMQTQPIRREKHRFIQRIIFVRERVCHFVHWHRAQIIQRLHERHTWRNPTASAATLLVEAAITPEVTARAEVVVAREDDTTVTVGARDSVVHKL